MSKTPYIAEGKAKNLKLFSSTNMTDADRARRKVFDHASTSDQERYPTSKTASASGSLFNGKEIASFKKTSTPSCFHPKGNLEPSNPKIDR